jgi:hypothetical protein
VAKKYILTGAGNAFGKQVKFFIFGDSEEVGDFITMSNLDIYVYIDNKLQTNERLGQFKDACFTVHRPSRKGKMYRPNTVGAENIEVKIEASNHYYNIIETNKDLLTFMKELS